MSQDDETPVVLTGRELRVLRYGSRQMRKRLERQHAKSTFVPEPGKYDVTAMKIEAHRAAERKLEAALRRLRADDTSSWVDTG